MAGFQLWVNLPARDKMCEPRYQDIAAERIPDVEGEGGARIRVIAGTFEAASGAVHGPVSSVATEPSYFDVTLASPRARFDVALPAGQTVFAYVFEGAVSFGSAQTPIAAGQLAVFAGDGNVLAQGVEGGGRFILLAGRPLAEPIVQHGPFVMNTENEIRQAISDFQAGRF